MGHLNDHAFKIVATFELPSAGKERQGRCWSRRLESNQRPAVYETVMRGLFKVNEKLGNPLPSLGGTLIHSLCSVLRYQAAFVCFGMAF